MQINAVKQNVDAIEYIKNPSPKLFTECKDVIIKYILTRIKNDISVISTLHYLNLHKVNWSEIDIVKKSLEADKK